MNKNNTKKIKKVRIHKYLYGLAINLCLQGAWSVNILYKKYFTVFHTYFSHLIIYRNKGGDLLRCGFAVRERA